MGEGDTSSVYVSPAQNGDSPQIAYDSLGGQINIAVWCLAAASLVFVVGRLLCKLWRGTRLWWDDWVLMTSWFMLLAYAILTSWIISLGYGKHLAAIDPSLLPTIALGGYGSGAPIVFALAWSKTSFALTLLRLMQGWWKGVLWFIIVSMNIFLTLSVIFIWVSCRPLEKLINPAVPGTCWPVQVLVSYATFSGAYSAAMDFLLALLPWKILLEMRRIRRAEKFGIAVAMSMGIFAGSAGIMRVTQLQSLKGGDFTYDGAGFVMWGAAEAAVTIIAASIPVLRVLVWKAIVQHDAGLSQFTWTNLPIHGAGSQTVTITAGHRSQADSQSKDDPKHTLLSRAHNPEGRLTVV